MADKSIIDGYHIYYNKKLGQGNYGVVWLAEKDGKDVAAKASDFLKAGTKNIGERIKSGIEELRQLQQNKHCHIVELLHFTYEHEQFWYFLDYCNKGNLSAYYMKENPRVSETISLMYQCADAMRYMHTPQMHDPPRVILHRDLKPNNILVKTFNNTVVVKIADFGFSRVVETQDIAKTFLFNTELGTAGYMAPEIFDAKKNNKPYGPPVDIFSMGLVYAAMLNHKKGNDSIFPPHGNMSFAIHLCYILYNFSPGMKPFVECRCLYFIVYMYAQASTCTCT